MIGQKNKAYICNTALEFECMNGLAVWAVASYLIWGNTEWSTNCFAESGFFVIVMEDIFFIGNL